jgi:hypothetical protein
MISKNKLRKTNPIDCFTVFLQMMRQKRLLNFQSSISKRLAVYPHARRELVEQYYGEYVEPVSLYISFDKSRASEYPLLNTQDEDLYFTVAPSLYLSEQQLRSILYDHIYLRRVEEIDYSKMPEQDFQYMKDFYRTNCQNTLGVGELQGGIWYPTFVADDSDNYQPNN